MRAIMILVALAILWAPPGPGAAQESAAPSQEAVDREVVIVGRQPGPQTWYVTNGDSEAFLFGALGPLPDAMEWDSSALARIIGQVDLVLLPPEVRGGPADAARLLSLTVTSALFRRESIYLPSGQTLADIADPALADRYATTIARLDAEERSLRAAQRAARRGETAAPSAPDPARFERVRQEAAKDGRLLPFWLAASTYADALDSAGLDPRPERVLDEIKRLARRAKAPVRPVQSFSFEASDGKVLLRAAREAPLKAQLACLEQTLDAIDRNLPTLEARANSWAVGDIARLRAAPEPEELNVCRREFLAHTGALASLDGKRLDDIDLLALYMDSLEKSLAEPGARLVVAPMSLVLEPNGLLDRLRAAGYEVRGP